MANGLVVGTFTAETSGVDDTNQAVTWGSPDFAPNFVMLWTAGDTTNGPSSTSGIKLSKGFTDGTSTYMAHVAYEDGSANANTSRRYSTTKLCRITDDQDTIDSECQYVSFDSKGFTVKWTKSSATATLVNYLALEANNVDVGTFTAATSTGSADVNHAAFTGNAAAILGTRQTTADTDEDDAVICFGMASGSANENVVSFLGEHGGATANDARGHLITACLHLLSDATPTVDCTADFTSFSSGKFTLNYSDAASSAWVMGYAVFDFDNVSVGSATNPSSDGDDDTITGLGFTPIGLITNSAQTTSAATGDGAFQMGAADGETTENNAMVGFYTDDGAANMLAEEYGQNDLCIRMRQAVGAGDRGNGKVISYSSGVVEFNWVSTSGSRRFGYMAIAQEASGAPPAPTQSQSIIFNASGMI